MVDLFVKLSYMYEECHVRDVMKMCMLSCQSY